MTTPVYNGAGRSGLGGNSPRGGSGSGRTWGVITGIGSLFGGNTPQYQGAGQPAPEGSGGGWFFGDGTPVYRTASSMGTAPTPGVTPSAATASQPVPQPGQVAIVVPRS
jgi:hypothetical protein